MDNTLTKLIAPAPESETVTLVEHGNERIVAYPWLTDQDRGVRLVEHIKDENLYTSEVFASLGIDVIKEEIRAELLSRLTDSESASVVDGKWSYYTKSEKEKSAPSHWRFPTGLNKSNRQLLLDEAEEAKLYGGQFTLGSIEVSDDDELLLITFDTSGAEEYTLQVRRILDGVVLVEEENVAADYYSEVKAVFNGKGDGIYFVRHDENQRNASISYREFNRIDGGFTSDEVCLYNEIDEEYWTSASISRDRKWIIVSSGSSATREVFLVDRNNPHSGTISFAGRNKGLLFDLDIFEKKAYLITDLVKAEKPSDSGGKEEVVGGGENNLYVADFIFDTSLTQLSEVSSWVKSLRLTPKTVLEGIELFETFTAFNVRIDGLQRVLVSPRDANGIHAYPSLVGNPKAMSAQTLTGTPNFTARSFGMVERGMQPEDTFTVSLNNLHGNTATLVHSHRYPELNPNDYLSQLIYATAPDGEKVPMVLISKKNAPVLGTLLCVYGAYGLSDELDYSAVWQSLLERGVACAVAYSRGGGELGQGWYHSGSLDRKINTLTDTLACANKIKQLGFAGSNGKNIVLQGGSAGGAAVAGTVNLDPEAFVGVVGQVPFVDCLATMLDPTLPLTITEYSEWGNPTDDEGDYQNIKSWAPIENLKSHVTYPPILAIAGLNDPRVGIWEPARWVLLLRELGNQAYLRTVDAGHGGVSDKFASISEDAERAAFIYWCLTNKD